MLNATVASMEVGSDLWIQNLALAVVASRSDGDFAALGRGLATRVEECLAAIEAGDQRLDGDKTLQIARLVHRRVAVLFIARWLVSGERTTPGELEWMGRLGEFNAALGGTLQGSIEGYYRWRDATITVLFDEGLNRGITAASVEKAVAMVRRSCDATLKRMAASFDAHRLEQSRALEESEGRVRTIFESMPCGGCLIGSDGRVILANRAAGELLHVRPDDLVGATDRDLTHRLTSEDGTRLSVPISEVARDTGEVQVETQLFHDHRTGVVRYLQIHAAPLLDRNGKVEAVLTIFMDVSSVRDAAEARRESEAQTRFLATMSHELRTPLNSILGFAQLLPMSQTGPLNARQTRYVDNISSSGGKLLSLINDVLDTAKVRAGELSVKVEPITLSEVATAVTVAMAHLAEAKGIDLECTVDDRLLVMADTMRLDQVLTNLVVNAVKFTTQGCITIAARRGRGKVYITVTDTGVGIPSDQLDRVFQDFVQVDAGSARTYEGTGLGLPLARRLAELMGGDLRLSSELGNGTTAHLTLQAA